MKFNTLAKTTAIAITLVSAPAFALTNQEAQNIVQPFYDFLSQPTNSEVATKAREVFHPSWRSYYNNKSSKGLDETIQSISGIGKGIPNLNWSIKDVMVSGNTVIVRSEASGTPAGPFFGVPHTGKSFQIMTIDLHEIKDGKVQTSYHIEDWAGAIKQLSSKK